MWHARGYMAESMDSWGAYLTTFLEKAQPLAERGFRCIPLVPRDKMPLALKSGDHFDNASIDITQLSEWSQQKPTANVGIVPDENWCYLETDSETEFKALCSDLPPEIWNTTRVSSGRPDRAYYIFRQTQRTRKVGNLIAPSSVTTDTLFEFKQCRVYVTGPGSIHPKVNPLTGENYVYAAEWKTNPAMHDVLLDRMCELASAPGGTVSAGHVMDDETKKQTALLESFCSTFQVATAGTWRNKGDKWILDVTCPWSDEHDNPNAGSSACIFYHEGGGYGFHCLHRCESKGRGWKEFRAKVQAQLPEQQFAFVENKAVVTFGTRATVAPVPEAAVPVSKRPVYPIEIFEGLWRGTSPRYARTITTFPESFLWNRLTAFSGRSLVTGLVRPLTVAFREPTHSLSRAPERVRARRFVALSDSGRQCGLPVLPRLPPAFCVAKLILFGSHQAWGRGMLLLRAARAC